MLGEIDGSAVLAGGETLLNVLRLDLVAPTALMDIQHQPACAALGPGELLAAVEIPAPVADSRVEPCHRAEGGTQ